MVGINDMPLAGWLHPPLTTVAVPQHELGVAAARMLVERIEGGADAVGPQRVSLPTHLVVRRSTNIGPGAWFSPEAPPRTT